MAAIAAGIAIIAGAWLALAASSVDTRPLLVFLHGKGEDQDSNLDDPVFAALAQLGARAPDVVFPYGGADS